MWNKLVYRLATALKGDDFLKKILSLISHVVWAASLCVVIVCIASIPDIGVSALTLALIALGIACMAGSILVNTAIKTSNTLPAKAPQAKSSPTTQQTPIKTAEEKTPSPKTEPAAPRVAVEPDEDDGEQAYDPQRFARILTSQLVAFWLDTGDEAYRAEYLRRIRMCGVDTEKAEEMLAFESGILAEHPRPELLREDFIALRLFSLAAPALEHPVEYYETHLEYPLSYVVKLSDEAEWHFWNSHEKDLPGEVWAEIYALSDKNKKLFIPFGMHLVEALGWSFANVNTFSYNEQGMLDYYRWGRKVTKAAKNPWGANAPS